MLYIFFSLETHELLWLDKLGYLAELRLKQADIVGNVSVGRLGLGTITSTRWETADKGVQRKLVQNDV